MTIFWLLVMLIVLFNDGWLGDFVRSVMIAVGFISLVAVALVCIFVL